LQIDTFRQLVFKNNYNANSFCNYSSVIVNAGLTDSFDDYFIIHLTFRPPIG